MTHTITLVSDVFVSKTEALRALSELFDTAIDDSNPSDAVLRLEGGVVLSIEVPKFGEDLPLTIDLAGSHRPALEEVAREVADDISARLKWPMTVLA